MAKIAKITWHEYLPGCHPIVYFLSNLSVDIKNVSGFTLKNNFPTYWSPNQMAN